MDEGNIFKKADSLRNAGKITESLEIYTKVAQDALSAGNNELLAESLHLSGRSLSMGVCSVSKYFHEALNYYQQAEKLHLQLGNEKSLGILYRDFAILCIKANLLDQSKIYLDRSIELLGEAQDLEELGASYCELGTYYFMEKDLTMAKEYATKGLDTLRSVSSGSFFHAICKYDLAKVYLKLDENLESRDAAEESLGWFEADHGEEVYLYKKAQLLGLLAIVYYKLGDSRKAKNAAELYENLSKSFSPEAAISLEHELSTLAS